MKTQMHSSSRIINKLICLLVISVLLSSCTSIYFESPQPAGQENLKEFPKKFLGLYKNIEDGDTVVVIYSDGFAFDANENTVKIPLNDKAILRKYKSYYFLNLQQEDSLWAVYIAKPGKKKIIELYDLSTDEEPLEKLRSITEVNKKSNEEGNSPTHFINPKIEEMDEIIESGLLQPVSKIKR